MLDQDYEDEARNGRGVELLEVVAAALSSALPHRIVLDI